MKYQRECLHDILDELRPLLQVHWEEIAHYPDIKLDPDYAGFLKLEELGFLRCYTGRDEGKMVAYAIFLVKESLHYQTSLQATQDILFVHPDYRKGMTGFRLVRFCDGELKREGVQVVYHHVKAAHNWGNLLEHMGYGLVDLIYAKRLDKE